MTHLPLKLCLELLDAGLLIDSEFAHYKMPSGMTRIMHAEGAAFCEQKRIKAEFLCACPTLEEMIEALPSFGNLWLNMDQAGGVGRGGWCVNEWSGKKVEGKTPAEAVARLWLALNKQDQDGKETWDSDAGLSF